MSRGDGPLSEPRSPDQSVTPVEEARRPRLGKRASLILGLVLILAGLALAAGAGWAKVSRTRTCAVSTLDRLDALQHLVPAGSMEMAGLDLGEMGVQLHGLQDDLACLQNESGGALALAPLLGWLPKVGDDVASAPDLFEMAQAVVNAGVLIADELLPLLEAMQARDAQDAGSGEGSLDLREIVSTLEAAQPALSAAEAELERAWELQLALEGEALSPRVARLVALTERYLPFLRTGVRAAQLAPELLGAEEARTYLILAQNDDERRPTGGWISGLGLVTVEQGQVTEARFSDSWAVDNLNVPHEVPPEAMLRTLWAEIWLFRDANWSPDFPTSAQVAEDILLRDQGIAVDGVIAVDQRALQLLVGALAPLDVASSEAPVSGTNVLAFIRESWAEPEAGVTLSEGWSEWVARRKDFMSDLVDAMLRKVQEQPDTVDLSQLAQSLWQGLQERHILVYLHDGAAAELLASQRWDGGILEVAGDYLQVVDANVGFNKVDPNVGRQIAYHVDLRDTARARAEAIVSYLNSSQRDVESCLQGIESLPTYEQRMEGCYWDYVRFYTKEGAQLRAAQREPVPPGSLLSRYRFAPVSDAGPDIGPVEQAKIPYGLFFVLAPGEERELRMEWQLAPGTVEQEADRARYRLLVQKQSGTPAIPLTVTVTLPPGAQLLSSSPEPAEVAGNLLSFSLSLETDQQIDLSFAPGAP
ncbi:MAG: DUF4012 domain-containing protein [Anaerolineae bacterium]